MSFWQNQKIRAIIYQIILILGVALAFAYASYNVVDNLKKRNITTGFGFLSHESSFGISESLISFTSADSYSRAFLVGILNTLNITVVGFVLAVILGLIVGIFLLSKNWLLRNISYGYVNAIRNTPLILQLLFWYMTITSFLPLPKNAKSFFGVYLTNRGVYMPTIILKSYHYYMLIAFIVGFIAGFIIRFWAKRRQIQTGKLFPTIRVWLALAIGLPFLVLAFNGFKLNLEFPRLYNDNIVDGKGLSPEFITLLFGLVIYTASFIAEIVRSGIVSISKGQSEAGNSIGLKNSQILLLIILPQAIRVIIPPLTNQLLNLFKNSTLAVAIGYPDLVSVANTTLNQTGQAVEAVLILMAFYLTGSLIVSMFMNWFNHRMRIIER